MEKTTAPNTNEVLKQEMKTIKFVPRVDNPSLIKKTDSGKIDSTKIPYDLNNLLKSSKFATSSEQTNKAPAQTF